MLEDGVSKIGNVEKTVDRKFLVGDFVVSRNFLFLMFWMMFLSIC